METRQPVRVIQALVLAALMVAAAAGYVDGPIRKLGMGQIAAANQSYLQQSMDKAVSGFLVLSGIKSGLAVIEGSEVGIGFNLEVGDIVQSVYDYVDIAWQTALIGGTVILITRLLLQTVDLIDHWCLALAFVFGFTALVLPWIPANLRRLTRIMRDGAFFFAVCSLVLYLVFPFSIAGAAFLSGKITGPLLQETHQSFESIKDEFSVENINRRLFPDNPQQDETSIAGMILKGKLGNLKEFIKAQAEYFKEKSRNIAIWTLQLIAGYIFDSIIFPVTFFVLLFVIVKGALLYLFEDRRQSSIKEDLQAMLQDIKAAKSDRSTRHIGRRPAGRRIHSYRHSNPRVVGKRS